MAAYRENDYNPFGMVEPGRIFTCSSNYQFSYQGSLKDNEIYGSDNTFTTEFRELDVRLGRWWSIDPEEERSPGESPYVSMGDNPIWHNDILGLVIKNGVEEEKNKAEADMNAKKIKLNAFGKNAKGHAYRKARREFKRAERTYQGAKSRYDATEQGIKDLKKYDPDLYNELNTLQDEGGTNVDVYFEVVDHVTTDAFKKNPNPDAKPLNGNTDLGPEDPNVQSYNNTTGKSYYQAYSHHYGENTIHSVIEVRVIDKGKIMAHEGGHIKYIMKNSVEYHSFLQTHPNDDDGHAPGDKSGEEANHQEEIYESNRDK